ncbi:DUF4145 domain-containing protein [Shewanella vesiculosa]|uniref:DUF4145 domain-containing protein n=1 Tax=Shewanella vesiculosa TaxID=518738 RepID=A0ABV0FXG4_9GAMM
MAELNPNKGTIKARCTNCSGALSLFYWMEGRNDLGAVTHQISDDLWTAHRLFKCSGCGCGALGVINYSGGFMYPGVQSYLVSFSPESKKRLKLPNEVPDGIKSEFREAEDCMANDCLRAAAGLFRSVLDKTMKANGYHTKAESNLHKQIEAAAKDGVITQARKVRAHEDIRVLGNDVLHDEWQKIPIESVEAAQHYSQRILEDLYGDRESVLSILTSIGRKASDAPQQD